MQNTKKTSLLLLTMLSLSALPNAQAEEKPATAPSQEAPAPTAPEPATPATPASTAPAPTAPEPATPAAPEPATPAPTAPAPATPAPTAPAPAAPAPTAPEPATPAPTAPEPATPTPTAPEPATPTPTAPAPAEPAPAPATSDATTPAKPIIEQQALDRLKQMSDTLIASKSFSYRSKSAVELLADNGQFVTFFTEADVALQRPNKLHMSVTGDTPNIQLFYDGTKVAAIDKENNIYAVSTPMSSIDEVLDFIMTKAQIGFPSADLMYSNPYTVMTKNLTDAIVIGESMVNGVLVDHFAYREPTIDWEIWMTKGEKPLPMRLAMTYKQVEAKPSFLVEFANWKLNPKLKDKMFEFKAPSDGKQIEFGNYSIPEN